MHKFLSLFLMTALSGMALAGCGDDKKNPTGTDSGTDAAVDGDVVNDGGEDAGGDAAVVPPTGAVRLVHAAPNLGAVDVYLTRGDAAVADDASPSLEDLELAGVFSAGILEADDYVAHVYAADADVATDTELTSFTFTVNENTVSAFIADDDVVNADEDELPETFLLNPIGAPVAPANVMLAAVGAARFPFGAIDVWAIADGADNDQLLLNDFEGGSQPAALELPVGTYDLGVDLDGADDQDGDENYSFTVTAPVTVAGIRVYGIVIIDEETPKVILYPANGTATLGILEGTFNG